MAFMHHHRQENPGLFRRFALAGLCLTVGFVAPASRSQGIVPAAMPDPGVSGYRFPESEATLTGWITEADRGDAGAPAARAKIFLHGWGLWTALTAETPQFFAGQRLRVFETWLTPEDLTSQPNLRTVGARSRQQRRRAPLRTLDQLGARARAAGPSTRTADDGAAGRVVGFVKFDPAAADHILQQRLLETGALDSLLQGGAQGVPPFPASALAVKSIFQVIPAADLVDGRYYALKAWSGPPAVVQAWGPAQWPGCVWIDLFDGGSGQGAIDEAPQSDGSTRAAETTYPLLNFIHYRLSADDAAAVNADKPATGASAGDYAILVGMHVAGREIARWTWQTFWWTPAPDDPPAPSSAAIASQRPLQLRGPARHYAMALAYTMLSPDQPYIGGDNAGAAVYAYNPWVEARFAPADLPDSQPGLDPAGRPAGNNYGVETNCMSCHARATYNPNARNTAPRFAGARYVDLIDPQFVGTLQVDFLWSLPRRAVSRATEPAASFPLGPGADVSLTPPMPMPLPIPDFNHPRNPNSFEP